MNQEDPNDGGRSRENVLAIALVVLVGGTMLFFLYMISLGVVGNVLMGGALIVLIGTLHYLVWGKAMSDEVAAEREALRRKEARETGGRKTKAAPDAIQDLSRTQGIKSEPDA